MDIPEMINYFEELLEDCCPSKGYTIKSVAPVNDLTIKDLKTLVIYLRNQECMEIPDGFWFEERWSNDWGE